MPLVKTGSVCRSFISGADVQKTGTVCALYTATNGAERLTYRLDTIRLGGLNVTGKLTDELIAKLTPFYIAILKDWSSSVARRRCNLTEKQQKEFLSKSPEAKAAHDEYVRRVMHRQKGV